MPSYATKLAESFAAETIKIYYQKSVIDMISNRNYEGEVKDKASKLNVLTFSKIKLKDFNGATMTPDSLTESNAQLTTDQQKASYFQIPSLAKFQSYIKNPEGTILEQVGNELKEVIDAFGLGFYTKAAAGNRVGTDYVTGTVTVTAVTGAVVGSGTTFTAAMVGRGFKAAGQASWYRVKSFTDTTHITIEDDLDDVASQYTGGAVAGGTSFTIEANTPVALTSSTIYGQIVNLKQKLDAAKIPASDRFLVIPSKVEAMLLQSTALVTPVDAAFEGIVKEGVIGKIAGMTIVSSEQVAGDNTNGYRVIAAHKSWLTFAQAYVETGIEPLIGSFGQAYKGLNVYGGKVIDERRKAGAELFCTA
jgi:hypothetical protein